MHIPKNAAVRKHWGKILVMAVLLLPAIMGFLALSVDVAVIATSRAQLKTVSDAAGLAGAMKLADERRVRGATDLSAEIAAAQSQAKIVAQDNKVLNAVPVIHDNPTNSADGDVVVGYYNPYTRSWTSPPLSNNLLMNAVMVNSSRSSTHGGVVPGFFSRAWGFGGSTVAMQSTAMAWNYPIVGYRPAGNTPGTSPSANFLPIVLDQDTYRAMMSGSTTDQYTYDTATRSVVAGGDGITESKLYPVASGSPGNWGTINVGVTENSTSNLAYQIMYGIPPSQLAMYPNSTIQLNPALDPPSITFSGNPGISAALKDALDSVIGKPVSIPIYDESGANGNNAWYRVVAFQACRIVDVDFQGAAKFVIIQPCLLQDGTAIPLTDPNKWPSSWNWKWGGLVRVHLTK